jgi:hypothetical protein
MADNKDELVGTRAFGKAKSTISGTPLSPEALARTTVSGARATTLRQA